jgi:hypothetical protein
MTEIVDDKKQIGLTAAGNVALGVLMDADLFATETDAYRFAIAYSLAKGEDPSNAPEGGYQTKFNAAGGLDVYGEIRDLITILRPEQKDRPYATSERLAELGLVALASRINAHDSLASVISEIFADPDTNTDTDSDEIEVEI